MKLKKSEELEFTEPSIEEVLPLLRKVKQKGKNYTALCPAHNDTRSSLSVGVGDDGKVLFYCHANCEYEDIIRQLGFWNEPKPSKFNVVNEYDYTDENGELIFQVVRLKPKGFAQRRMDKNGEWVYNLKGVVRVLYNLPNLIDATQIIIVEGEKDAEKLNELGYVATTNSGGAGKWLKEYNKYFKGVDVIIIPDNDPVGFAHAEEVGKSIFQTVKSLKIIKLDGLEEKQDLSDWLKKNDTLELAKLIDVTEPTIYDEEDLIFDETMPSSIESEMAILGAILKNGKLITKAIEANLKDDFYFPKNKKILKAMLSCFDAREKIDFITIGDKLKQSGDLVSVGGVDFLKELADYAPDAINFDDWVKILTSKSDLRKYIDISKKAAKISYGELDAADNIGNEIGQEIHKIRRKHRKSGYSRLFDTAEIVVERTRNIEQGTLTGLSTGFVDIDEITSGLQKTDLIIVAGRPSMGKCLSNDYKVLTPYGWTTMGQLKVGDFVIGSDGLPTKVIGVFPQGFKPMYEIGFYDGTKSESCDEHLWFVQSRQDRKAGRKGQVLPLKDIAESLRTADGKRNNYCIPYVSPVCFLKRNNTLHPYLLGALIGDGSLSGSSVGFSNIDKDVLYKVRLSLPETDKMVGNYKDYRIIRKQRNNEPSSTKFTITLLGLNKKANEKFIPESYLYDSKERRIELLRGLLDTDGSIEKKGWIEYSTVSKQLAEDVRELALSLGGRSTIQSRITKYTYKGVKKEGQLSYRVKITFPSKEFNPFHCSRKAERFEQSTSKRKNGRYIVSISYVGLKEATCIKVDAEDQLFVIKDYILTHNTAISLNIATNVARTNKRVMMFSLEMSKEQLASRVIASEARVNATAFRNGNLDKYAWGRIANVLPQIEELDLLVDDTPGLSIAELRSKTYEYLEELGEIDLIVLDYIQLMSGSGRENRQQDVSQISRDLKGLAKELNIPVMALSQLSRAPEGRSDNRPRMSDLRESGSIEQDADVVAFVFREEYYNKTEMNQGLAELIFAKQRNGATGTIDLGFIDKFTRFENLFLV